MDPDLVSQALTQLELRTPLIDTILQSLNHSDASYHLPAFGDLPGFSCNWIPRAELPRNIVANPFNRRISSQGGSCEFRVVFRWLLQQRKWERGLSSGQEYVLNFYDIWETTFPNRFSSNYKVSNMELDTIRQLDFFKRFLDHTDRYFMDRWRKVGDLTFYRKLISAHITVNAGSLKEAEGNINSGKSRNDGRVGQVLADEISTERAFLYVDNIPAFVAQIEAIYKEATVRGLGIKAEKAFNTVSNSLEDDWWMLMMRGQCWEMSVNLAVQKSRAPSSLFNSPTRVYLM